MSYAQKNHQIPSSSTPVFLCPSGYTGERYEENIDDCSPSISVQCGWRECIHMQLAMHGYEGVHCDREKNPCSDNPCAIGSTAVREQNMQYASLQP